MNKEEERRAMRIGADETYLKNLNKTEKDGLSVNIPFSTETHAKAVIEILMRRSWNKIRICLNNDGYNYNNNLVNSLKDIKEDSTTILSIKVPKDMEDIGGFILFDKQGFFFIKANGKSGIANLNNSKVTTSLFNIFEHYKNKEKKQDE